MAQLRDVLDAAMSAQGIPGAVHTKCRKRIDQKMEKDPEAVSKL